MKVAIISLDEATIQKWLDANPDVSIVSVSIDGGNVMVLYK